MVVGVLRIVLSLRGNDSLKGKRSVVKSVLERTRNKFHVSAAEVEDMDAHQRAVLAFCCVANDKKHVDRVLATVADFVEGASEAPISDRRTELITVDADDMTSSWELDGQG